MMKINRYVLVCGLILAGFSCRHPLEPPTIPADSRPLVVEGFINVGTDATTSVTLSRVQNVSSADTILPELGAQISIEGQAGDVHALSENGQGKYSVDHLNLNPSETFRLSITTTDGSKFASDYVEAKVTPPIDSLEWDQNSDVNIYVNTHDPSDNTRYYRWDYIETWNYMSNYQTPWGMSNRWIFVKDEFTQTDSCWRTNHSTDIITGTTVALSHDVVARQPITTVPINDEKISKRYSILVRQYALTKDAYQFREILKKNTQQTGGLYDPQPSQLSTNIHCLSNPNEMVIGFVNASTIQEARIFIQHSQVQDWNYSGVAGDCSIQYIGQNPTDFRIFDYPDTTWGPYYFISGGGLAIMRRTCTDCTLWGGTNVKPSFW